MFGMLTITSWDEIGLCGVWPMERRCANLADAGVDDEGSMQKLQSDKQMIDII